MRAWNINNYTYKWLFTSSILFSIAIVSTLYFFYTPIWETNDDVGMSMIAHGYGMSKVGSPCIIFSNVIWGYLVRLIPTIYGILGYSVATIFTLIIISSVYIYGLRKRLFHWSVCSLIIVIVLLRPLMFPQFTINSGLLMVSSLILMSLYSCEREGIRAKIELISSFVLAYASYLIREQEMLLVFFVAVPLLSWKSLLQDRWFSRLLMVFVTIIAVSIFINWFSYQGKEWNAFNAFNNIIAIFTDFGIGERLSHHTDLLSHYKYTVNDVNLVANWFFADQSIADSEKLKSMVNEIGFITTQNKSFYNGVIGIKTLFHPEIVFFSLVALLVFCLQFSRRLMCSWVILSSALFVLGFLGRPGILRVYISLLVLIIILPLMNGSKERWQMNITLSILITIAFMSTSFYLHKIKLSNIKQLAVQKAYADFPVSPIIIWANSFPYETIYRPLNKNVPKYHIYSLSTLTLAPFSIQWGKPFAKAFVNDWTPIVMKHSFVPLLSTYCKEHFHGRMESRSTMNGTYLVRSYKCNVY